MTTNIEPRMALLSAIFQMKQANMGELMQLAEETKASNDLLEEIRKVEDLLRKAKADKRLTRGELDELRRAADLANARGASIDIGAYVDAIERDQNGASRMADEHQSGRTAAGDRDDGVNERGDFVWADASSAHQGHRDSATQLDNIGEALKAAKDAEKGRASNRELDMQRVVQDASSLDQLYSNLSKTFDSVDKTIIGNIRA